MFLITIFMYIDTSLAPTGSSENYSDSSGINIDDENRSIIIPGAESQEFDIWGSSGIIVIVIAAIAIGVVSGITVLGSGLSDEAQKMIVNSVLFLGLWACLSVVSSSVMFENMVTIILWFSITMIFMLGLSIQITGGDVE
jgi:hypothetical protein